MSRFCAPCTISEIMRSCRSIATFGDGETPYAQFSSVVDVEMAVLAAGLACAGVLTGLWRKDPKQRPTLGEVYTRLMAIGANEFGRDDGDNDDESNDDGSISRDRRSVVSDYMNL